ncbi:helix-turn-helix domain-containing protein [Ohtaekwangia sp.]|uniref:helix-turn-helix domain-containing protein n=2 Tax=Ohtaekwangia sp. TaxID=2066019 RepID=UPI002FDD76E7
MPETPLVENEFVNQLVVLIEQNLANEQFGVSELADQMNMSRSNLLRRVKKETNLSVSQLISQVRLKKGMELLRTSTLNVSEVSHQVGFNSTSYFIKCFREYYGYPPGEVGRHDDAKEPEQPEVTITRPSASSSRRNRNVLWVSVAALIVAGGIGWYIYSKFWAGAVLPAEKSIAVLPFKNESSDSANIYLINGLMESTLNNLQKIRELKVISRTSAEKYRNTTKSIPEMAQELNANYFIEGSGQKVGDEILLHIQLIDGRSDRHLWSKQYKRQVNDIFTLQEEIAQNIAEEIQVIITPDEQQRIARRPTENLEAYDLYLKGRNMFRYRDHESLKKAEAYFNDAIALDPQFGLAYAEATIAYYYLDAFQSNPQYTDKISNYSDKALLLEPKAAESLIAKGLFYQHKHEYSQAAPYFEKALEYNPGSAVVVHFLSEYYNIYNPNTAKYIKYALMGIGFDKGSTDSINLSYRYLQLSNALLQTGFFDESMKYIDKSLAYNPKNPFGYIQIFIRYAKDHDMNQAKASLEEEFRKDTTRLDVIDQLASMCYMMKDYKESYKYVEKFNRIRDSRQLDIYKNEDLKIAIVLEKMGMKDKAKPFVTSYKNFADTDESIYKDLFLMMYYVYQNDTPKALAHFRAFSEQENFQYWVLLLVDEPSVEPLRNNPEFRQIMKKVEDKFWSTHNRVKQELEEEGLLGG